MSGNINWELLTDAPLTLDWPASNLLEIELGGRKLTLAKWDGKYFAFSSKCPHASGKMASGYINPLGQVVCPLHRYAFDMKNGRNTSGEGYFLKTYPVETRPEGIFIGFKPFSLF
jgi:3-phenylpropionate/trans-cinnamate dioxygenase ferredoxin subunit